jgi:hypothetical protein
MLITLIALVLIITGIWMMNKKNDDMEFFGSTILIIGSIAMFVCLVIILCQQTMTTRQINRNMIRYESLQKRLEIVNSEYEDVSKSDVIKDIASWNQEAYNYNYWNSNLFTNWMYSDKVAESYKYIEY